MSLQEPQDIHVLLVEDDDVMRRTLERQLSRIGCASTSTGNASDFLTALHDEMDTIDLAIVDIRLPGLNGDLLITWLRESELGFVQSLPVIITTGYPGEIPDDILLDPQRIKLLVKPYTLEALRQAIEQLMNQGRVH